MRRRFLNAVLLLFAVPLCAAEAVSKGPAAPGSPTWETRLAAAMARAAADNPSIAEMESRIGAAKHRIGQAGALPDPEVEVGIQDIPPSDFSFTRDDFTMEKITARQTFPAAGKRPARERSAEAQLEAVSALHADHVVRITAEVADAFFAVADLDTRIGILEGSRERLKRIAADAGERYRVGKGVQADVLRANLEVTAADDRLADLRGQRRMAAVRLNALQALPPATEVDPIEIPGTEPGPPSAEETVRDAETHSPAVAAAAADVRRAEEELGLARLERRPDFTATGYYAYRVDYEDLVGASVALNLPFFQPKRLKEKEAEREAELSGARANLNMVKNEIGRGVGEASADLDRLLEQVRLYRGSILPQAQTNAAAAQEAYSVGQVDFLTYLRAALDLDTYQAELAARRAAAWRAVAALQVVSGLPLLPGMPAPEVSHE